MKILTKKTALQFLSSPDSFALGQYQRIQLDAAKILADFQGHLNLSGLTDLSSESATALGKHGNGYRLILDGLRQLSEPAAKKLAQHLGPITLDGLTTLSAGAAMAFSNRSTCCLDTLYNSLSIGGPKRLSIRAIKFLAEQTGPLHLDGLTQLSRSAAKALSQHKGHRLSLAGLTELSVPVAKELATYQGHQGQSIIRL